MKQTISTEKTFTDQISTKPKRICMLDELRGIAVIAMILYHAIYSMAFIGNFPFAYNWLLAVLPYQPLIPITFISICGIFSSFSRNNLKNGIKLFSIAIVITIVTAVVIPSNLIVFGILHFLGCGLIIVALLKTLLDKVSSTKVTAIIIIACIVAYGVCFNIPKGHIGVYPNFYILLPQSLYSCYPLSILGFPSKDFYSADYFPIFPHILLFIAGVFLGKLINKILLPDFAYKNHSKILGFIGKHALVIYIAHQPLIIGFIYVVKMFL